MEYTAFDIALVPVIVGLVALFTGLGLPKRIAPVVALGFGVLGGTVYVAPTNLSEGILVGVTIGLAASGLYSGTKNVIKPPKDSE